MSVTILPDDQADFPGLIPVAITIWVKHPELAEVVRDIAETLATYLNCYAGPIEDFQPDITDTIDARQRPSPVREGLS